MAGGDTDLRDTRNVPLVAEVVGGQHWPSESVTRGLKLHVREYKKYT